MTQVVIQNQKDRVEEIFSDPNDPRLFDHDLLELILLVNQLDL